MEERQPICSITATDAAISALDTLSAEHGPLILHITAGGEDSGSPICLPAADLHMGPRDIYVGTVHGVHLFEMRSHTDSHFRDGSFVLDVSRGLPVGFSLTPGNHVRFIIRDCVATNSSGTH
jgi:uncharacterized protein